MKAKKLISAVLAMTVSVTAAISLASCGEEIESGIDFNESVDTTKTQLYVGNYNGGLGWEWLNKAKLLYEAEHPNVQIMIDNDKDAYSTATLMTAMPFNRQDLYVLDGLDYYQMVNAGHLMDVTDVVTKGGNDSIAARMNETLNVYYKTSDSKYYAVPFYQAFFHMIYDVDLFDEYLLWFNKDGTGFVSSLDEERYPGMSGEKGSWDEGLPRTYSQFFMLLDKMVECSITPVTWTGKYKDGYLPWFSKSIWADYVGSDAFDASFSLNGSIKTITSDFTDAPAGTFSLPASAYSTEQITRDTASDVISRDAGKYYLIKFAKDLTGGNYKYLRADKVNSPSETHTSAQDTFLRSRYLASTTGKVKPIGMLIESGWWYNEAKVVLRAMEEYGEEWGESGRKLGIMPVPKADDGSSAEGRTVLGVGNSVICVSNYTQKKELAKDFFAFINSPEIMELFTAETYVKRPYRYDISEEKIADMPYYVKNMLAAVEEIDVQYPFPRMSELVVYDTNIKSLNDFYSTFNGYTYMNPITNFFENPGFTAHDYFKGMATYWQNISLEW